MWTVEWKNKTGRQIREFQQYSRGMAMVVLIRVETIEVVRIGQILGILERRPEEFANRLKVKVKYDLKIFVLSHWQYKMEKTLGEKKAGSPWVEHVKFRICIEHNVEMSSRRLDL